MLIFISILPIFTIASNDLVPNYKIENSIRVENKLTKTHRWSENINTGAVRAVFLSKFKNNSQLFYNPGPQIYVNEKLMYINKATKSVDLPHSFSSSDKIRIHYPLHSKEKSNYYLELPKSENTNTLTENQLKNLIEPHIYSRILKIQHQFQKYTLNLSSNDNSQIDLFSIQKVFDISYEYYINDDVFSYINTLKKEMAKVQSNTAKYITWDKNINKSENIVVNTIYQLNNLSTAIKNYSFKWTLDKTSIKSNTITTTPKLTFFQNDNWIHDHIFEKIKIQFQEIPKYNLLLEDTLNFIYRKNNWKNGNYESEIPTHKNENGIDTIIVNQFPKVIYKSNKLSKKYIAVNDVKIAVLDNIFEYDIEKNWENEFQIKIEIKDLDNKVLQTINFYKNVDNQVLKSKYFGWNPEKNSHQKKILTQYLNENKDENPYYNPLIDPITGLITKNYFVKRKEYLHYSNQLNKLINKNEIGGFVNFSKSDKGITIESNDEYEIIHGYKKNVNDSYIDEKLDKSKFKKDNTYYISETGLHLFKFLHKQSKLDKYYLHFIGETSPEFDKFFEKYFIEADKSIYGQILKIYLNKNYPTTVVNYIFQNYSKLLQGWVDYITYELPYLDSVDLNKTEVDSIVKKINSSEKQGNNNDNNNAIYIGKKLGNNSNNLKFNNTHAGNKNDPKNILNNFETKNLPKIESDQKIKQNENSVTKNNNKLSDNLDENSEWSKTGVIKQLLNKLKIFVSDNFIENLIKSIEHQNILIASEMNIELSNSKDFAFKFGVDQLNADEYFKLKFEQNDHDKWFIFSIKNENFDLTNINYENNFNDIEWKDHENEKIKYFDRQNLGSDVFLENSIFPERALIWNHSSPTMTNGFEFMVYPISQVDKKQIKLPTLLDFNISELNLNGLTNKTSIITSIKNHISMSVGPKYSKLFKIQGLSSELLERLSTVHHSASDTIKYQIEITSSSDDIHIYEKLIIYNYFDGEFVPKNNDLSKMKINSILLNAKSKIEFISLLEAELTKIGYENEIYYKKDFFIKDLDEILLPINRNGNFEIQITLLPNQKYFINEFNVVVKNSISEGDKFIIDLRDLKIENLILETNDGGKMYQLITSFFQEKFSNFGIDYSSELKAINLSTPGTFLTLLRPNNINKVKIEIESANETLLNSLFVIIQNNNNSSEAVNTILNNATTDEINKSLESNKLALSYWLVPLIITITISALVIGKIIHNKFNRKVK
ncbi:hypothetical protein EI74_0608 [Mycoplasma testudineum]|uniref:Uncharacterized protein n=2 Tax=Mycoplasma testudineum TaxID=244584 RepID=A0A4R6ID30_9MOLU|nr:hypothetical protein EI74_0608 [Mycoplasma testudineum]